MKNDALSFVLLRNAFYRDGYRCALVALFIVLVVNCGLAAVFVYQLKNPPATTIFCNYPRWAGSSITTNWTTPYFRMTMCCNGPRTLFGKHLVWTFCIGQINYKSPLPSLLQKAGDTS